MHDFLIKEVCCSDLTEEILSVGFDKSYADKVTGKYSYKNLKIFNLTVPQANILKQTALSVGADCATHRDVITGNVELSSCILGGSISQISKIADKLQFQPFGLKVLGEKLKAQIHKISNVKTKLIGVLNLTEDSFSDGGMYSDFESAKKRLNELVANDADIIDIGAESTRPDSQPVDAQKQLERLLPILDYAKAQNIPVPISVDTRSSVVAEECIKAGASIINDVSGFDYDSKMIEVVAKYPHVKVILQHSLETPDKMQKNVHYDNLMDEIFISLNQKVVNAVKNGILKDNIIIDPGICFGKLKAHNLEIIARCEELKSIGCPVLVGVSRKSFLGLGQASNEEKDIFTLAFNSILINKGIDYLRVHNVELHRKFIDMLN